MFTQPQVAFIAPGLCLLSYKLTDNIEAEPDRLRREQLEQDRRDVWSLRDRMTDLYRLMPSSAA